jgi:fluoride exporter
VGISLSGLVLVALGGALGSVLRWLGATGMTRLAGVGFPWGTLLVNVVGSFAIGVAAARIASVEWRLFVITGLLGGFTTYSAFNEETLAAWRAGASLAAIAYLAATVVVCLAAGVAGAAVARAG